MPPGPTLDWVGRLAERERPGDGDAHQCRTPVALGAQRSPTQVKGGIARASGSRECWGKKVDMHKSSYIMTDAHSRVVHEREEEPVPDVCTGLQQRLHLISRQGLRTPFFTFDRNDTSLH